MSTHPFFAIYLIAASALSTGSMAQSVYKCGTTYSQTPCEGSVVLNVADQRSKEQQSQNNTTVAQDAKTAASMEKARLKEEAKVRAGRPVAQKTTPTTAVMPEKRQKSVPTTTILNAGASHTGARSKNKEPEFFTATVTPDKKKRKGEDPR